VLVRSPPLQSPLQSPHPTAEALTSSENRAKLRCASPSRIEKLSHAPALQPQQPQELAPVSSPKPTEDEEEIKRL
jgi:hypothetical protein